MDAHEYMCFSLKFEYFMCIWLIGFLVCFFLTGFDADLTSS